MSKNFRSVFVTGATGKIGRTLVEELLKRGYNVVALVRDKSRLPLNHSNLKIITADILELNKFKKEIRACDYVYHLAAYQNPIDQNKKEFIRVNVEGTKFILRALIGSKVKRFIYVSTAMVFKPTSKKIINEKWAKRVPWTGNNYLDSKLLALEVIDKYKPKIPLITLYPTIVIDASEITGHNKSQNQGWHSIIRNVVGGGVSGAAMCMVGDKNRMMNYVFLENLTMAMIGAMDRGEAGDDYILGGENITADNYLREVERIRRNRFLPIRIPLGLLKLAAIMNIFQLKLINFIVKNPPEDMCVDSRKAIISLGLKIWKLKDIYV
jgi:nucleoside-diphosphate-sugar epimerase